MTANNEELREILDRHEDWLNGKEGGVRADFSTKGLYRLDFSNANLKWAIFDAAYVWFCDFSNSNLHEASMRQSQFYGCAFCNSEMNGIDAGCSSLINCNFYNAKLRSSNFYMTRLTSSSFLKADLESAEIEHSGLYDVSGDGKYIKNNFLYKTNITYTSDVMCIAGKKRRIEEWWSLPDEEIEKIGGAMLKELWGRWKHAIKKDIELSPAEPTITE